MMAYLPNNRKGLRSFGLATGLVGMLAGCSQKDSLVQNDLALIYPKEGEAILLECEGYCDYSNGLFRGWGTGQRWFIRPKVLYRGTDKIDDVKVSLELSKEGIATDLRRRIKENERFAPRDFNITPIKKGQEITFKLGVSPYFSNYTINVNLKTVSGEQYTIQRELPIDHEGQ